MPNGLGLCFGGRWEKVFGGCSKCIHCTKCVASGNDEDWETFQSHARTVEDIPRPPEIEGIKELPAPELAEDVPRNQCPWYGLALQRSTSVHWKFCMKMPIRMWFARQRATSRNYNEFGEGRPYGHCGSICSEAHARARHEKQSGDRFTSLGWKKSRNFHSNDLGRHWTQRRTQVRSKISRFVQILTSKLTDACQFSVFDLMSLSLFVVCCGWVVMSTQ